MAEPVRGEVYLGRFDIVERTTFASVPRKRHVLVAAIASNPKCGRLPFCVPVEAGGGSGLDRESYVNASHVHSFSKDRLLRRLGKVGPESLRSVDLALRLILNL